MPLLLRCVATFGHYRVMAYTGRGSTGSRDGHGWAIAGAFAGQAAIIVGLGVTLTTATTSGAVTQVITGPVPAAAAPGPVISAVPLVRPLTGFQYQVAMDGQHGGGVFPDAAPALTVKPGQDLVVSLDVTVPSGRAIIDMRVSLVGPTQGSAGTAEIRPSYNDSVQSQAPGTRVFLLSWPGSASELQPGTQWMVVLTTGAPGASVGGVIARITVAP